MLLPARPSLRTRTKLTKVELQYTPLEEIGKLPLPLVPVSSSLPAIASSSLPPVAASSPLLPAPPPPRCPSPFPTWRTAMHGLWNGNKDLSAMWKKLGERGIWWTTIPYMHTYSPATA
ncbi:hypothetical protein K525DRAFT_273964 [Schizophyllum commune Loenen D]|nr:hypothetical protein K525DRAFT_273964 [Schizophyllum commune Loenen D]